MINTIDPTRINLIDPNTLTGGAMNVGAQNLVRLTVAMTEGSRVRITYTDLDNVYSVRTIKVRSIARCDNGVISVLSDDLNRGGVRRFRLDRIEFVSSPVRG